MLNNTPPSPGKANVFNRLNNLKKKNRKKDDAQIAFVKGRQTLDSATDCHTDRYQINALDELFVRDVTNEETSYLKS